MKYRTAVRLAALLMAVLPAVSRADYRASLQLAAKFQAKSPREILANVHRSCAESGFDLKGCPELAISTRSGQTFYGRIVGLAPQTGGDVAVIALTPSQTAPFEVAYLPVDEITSLVIRGPEQLAPVLSAGLVGRAPGEDSPTKLALERAAADLRDTVKREYRVDVRIEPDAFPDTDTCRLNLQEVIATIPVAVAAVARDDMGRQAIGAAGSLTVTQAEGAGPDVSRGPSGLRFEFDCDRALPKQLAAEIEKELNEVL